MGPLSVKPAKEETDGLARYDSILGKPWGNTPVVRINRLAARGR